MKLLLKICLVMIFLSGSLYTTTSWRALQPYLLLVSTGLILFLALMLKAKRFRINSTFLMFFFLFIISSIISSLLHLNFEQLGGVLLMLYIYISLVIILPTISKIIGYNNNFFLLDALFLGHIPIVLLPIIFGDFRTQSYKGIFYNSNSFGVVAVTLFTAMLSILVFEIERFVQGNKVKNKNMLWSLVLSVLFFMLIIFSSSRTAFLTGLSIVLTALTYLLVSIKSVSCKINIKIAARIGKLLLMISVLFLLVYNTTSFVEILDEGIFSKFEAKSDDVFDGRTYVWKRAIIEAKIFGHGRSYFINGGSHNTFISILGQYGLLPVLFYILFLAKVLIRSMKYPLKKCNDANNYKYLPLFAALTFIMLSMGEGMMLKTSMLLLFSIIGFMD